MKNKKIISVFSFVFALIMIFPLFSVFISANSVIPQHIDTSHVSDDLKRMEAYDADRYDVDKTVDYCEIIDLIEYGYAYDGSTANYALYLYIYNPSCTKLIVENNVYNRVQLRVAEPDEEIAGGDTPWTKYSMTFLNCSLDNLFYKFRIDVPKSFMREVQMGQRVYEIADVELLYNGDVIPRSVGASGKWIYSGYQEYHGPYNGGNTTSTLSWTSKVLETLELDLNPASWKTKTSSKGEEYQHELSSVYFSVPDKIIKDYGDPDDVYKGLRKVSGVYDNYKTTGLITKDLDLYSTFESYAGKSASSCPFGFTTKRFPASIGTGGGSVAYKSNFYFNMDAFPGQSLLYAWNVMGKELYSYGNAYLEDLTTADSEWFYDEVTDLYNSGELRVKQGTYPKDTFEVTTDDGDLRSKMVTYAKENGENWLFYWITGNPKFQDEDIGECEPIVVVDESYITAHEDTKCGETYFISDNDASDFCSYVKNNASGKTTFLMRFAVTDYYCSDLNVFRKGSGNDISEGNGNYYFEKEIFLNFDILSLTWENKNGVRTVLPVKSSPIHITGDPTPPVENDNFWERVENTFGGGKDDNPFDGLAKWLKILLVLIVVILIVVLISKVPGLAKAIGTVVALPFKAVGSFIGTVSDAAESRERRKKSKAERKEIGSRQADREADRAARKAEKDADREERRQENEARRAERAAERAARRNKNKKEDE